MAARTIKMQMSKTLVVREVVDPEDTSKVVTNAVGPQAGVDQLDSFSDTLFEAPDYIGSFFFVGETFFKDTRDSHPRADDPKFKEWSSKFSSLSLFPITRKTFSKAIDAMDDEDEDQAGDVVIFGTTPRPSGEIKGHKLKDWQKFDYVVYISTAEGIARALPAYNAPDELEPTDLWGLYTTGKLEDDDKADKDDIGMHGIIDYVGYPEITFLAINPTPDELKKVLGGGPYMTLTRHA